MQQLEFDILAEDYGLLYQGGECIWHTIIEGRWGSQAWTAVTGGEESIVMEESGPL